MTVNSTIITSGPYLGNGTSANFSYTFRVTDKTQLKVYETDDIGLRILLTVDTDYTVAGIGVDTGGIITRVAGNLPTDFEWYIRSDYKKTQLTALPSQGPFFPDVHEDVFDKLTFLIQQLNDIDSRTFRLSEAIDVDGVFEITDDAAARAANFLSFDNNGDLILAAGTTNITVSAFMAGVNLAANAFDATGLLKSGYVVATKTEALLLTPEDGRKVFVTSPDGGSFTMRTGAPVGTYTDDSVLSMGTRSSSGDGSSGILRDNIYALNVQWYGALCDSVTNNITAFNEAKAKAKKPSNIGHSAIYIPGGHDRKYYRIDSEFLIDTDSIRLYGDGLASVIVQHNSSGANCITVSGNAHRCQIQDIAIVGVVGSGIGLEITGTSHYGEYSNIYIGYMGGVGLQVTSGQSGLFTNINVDQNGGYSPTTIVGATQGNCTMGYYIAPDISGNTNNQSFVNCRTNGIGVDASGNYALKIGDAGSPIQITTFSWVGGVIQGSSNNELVYIKCDEVHISQTHLESTSTATEYILTIDGSRNCDISESFILGDINVSGVNKFLNIDRISGVGGINIATTTTNSEIKNLVYRSNINGPTLGSINDSSNDTVFTNVTSVNGDQDILPGIQTLNTVSKYYGSLMETWVGGTSPTVPCGFDAGGGGTVTRDTTTVRRGTYSAKIVYTAANTQGFRMDLTPANLLSGKKVSISAWVYAESGTARIRAQVTGGSDVSVDGRTNGVYEHMTVTFVVDPAATIIRLLFTSGGAATLYWDSIDIYVEDYTPVLWRQDAGGSPTLSNDPVTGAGYPVETIFASGSATIGAFIGPHVGVKFTLYFDSAKTVQDSATVMLAGAVDFVASADDTLTLLYCDDGLFREVSRSVN